MTPGDPGVLGEPVEQLLAAWPQCRAIQGKVGPDRIRLTMSGLRMHDPKDLDTVIQLGTELLKRFSVSP